VKKKILLTAWLILPLAAVVLLCVWIAQALQRGPIGAPPPRGQGAGQTGGANAIGQLLAGRRADGTSREDEVWERWELIVQDKSGVATEADPIRVTNSLMAWDPGVPESAMTLGEDGLWRWQAEIPVGGEAFEFAFTRGSWQRAEVDPTGRALPRRVLPRNQEPEADGFRRATFIIDAFKDTVGGG
jgi:hypothetical protein